MNIELIYRSVGRSQAHRHEFLSVRRRIGTAVVSFVGVSARLVVYSGRRHISTRACMGAGAVYTGTKEWLLFLGLGRVRQGPISVLAKTLF